MTFVLNRNGARREIEAFLAAQRGSKPIYWVTYVAHAPPEELLTFLRQKKSIAQRLHIICRHPGTARPDETIVAKTTFKRLTDLGIKIRGLRTREDALDDDEAIDIGGLHAKFIVSETDLLIGSFNFSAGSVSRACECTLVVEDDVAHKKSLTTALELWELAEDLAAEDCQDDPARVEREEDDDEEDDDAPIRIADRLRDSPSRQRQTRPVRHRARPARQSFPDPYGPLIAALDESLMDWPRGSGKSWQYDCYNELKTRDLLRDILYLPVGCGKTHIGLRWLLERLATEDAHRQGRVGVFLTPNAWVQRSVKARVDELFAMTSKKFKRFRARPEDVIIVGRAADVGKRIEPGRVAAVVADEVHNWNHHEPRAEVTYTGYLDAIARSPKKGDPLPLLGLSATPCRIEAGSFSSSDFVGAWMDAEYFDEASRPMRRFDWAVDEGVVSRPIWHTIAREQQAVVKDLLLSRNIAYGDYSQVVLRDIWRAIAGTSASCTKLAKEIVAHARAKKRTKCVIFLPPVADESTQFVRSLRKAAAHGEIFDFRSAEASNDAGHVFQEFADFKGTSTKPGFLLAIDRFSEGVSVDDIDMLVLLRATLSPRVAVQQLGRGCRLHPGKTSFDILDAVQFRHLWLQWDGDPSAADAEDDIDEVDDEPGAPGDDATSQITPREFGRNLRAFLGFEGKERLARLAQDFNLPSSGTKEEILLRVEGYLSGLSIGQIRYRKGDIFRCVTADFLKSWADEHGYPASRPKDWIFDVAWAELMVPNNWRSAWPARRSPRRS